MGKELLVSLCRTGSEMVHKLPQGTRIRVVSHYDADGVTSAGIICNALYDIGYDFHATLMRNPYTKGLERLLGEEHEFIIFCDMGSGQIDMIERFRCPVIILDHHQYVKKETRSGILQINANLCGYDGNYEICGATLSYAFAAALNPSNDKLIPLALVGATGDKQYIGGFRGYNREILETALSKGLLRPITGLKLSKVSISEELQYSIEPYYKGLSGRESEIKKVLDKIGIKSDSKPSDLTPEEIKRLNSYLILNLIKNKCDSDMIDTVIRERYWSDLLDSELERYADILDACGKNGYRGLALSLCFNNETVLMEEAKRVEKEYKSRILSTLLSLEDNGLYETDNMCYFYSDDSSLGGVIAGIFINYITGGRKPVFAISRKPDEVHISCRGTVSLVKNGLDLGSALKTITTTMGGYGGGHKVAAGATINPDKEKDFLLMVDSIIGQQMKRK
ncbi:MAG: DHH family phosphoesterase [Candidatus Thermoplasmatota archaeon]